MRRLFPDSDGASGEVAPLDVYAADDRRAPAGRPWVLLNMISSIDGAISVEGRSGGLGGPADKAVFGAVRAIPDVILVGSGTVIAERYRSPRPSDEVRALRMARGQAPAPRLAIVTASLRIDPGHDVFADPGNRPLIITAEHGDAERAAALGEVADVVQSGSGGIDLAAALGEIRRQGATTVLCEGGPTLNGALVDTGLLDELCLSFSPTLVGGDSPRIVHGASAALRSMQLDRILEDDGMLFLRYLRAAPTAG
jgi:riboflavin-specific deaminase-like protein